MNGFSRLCLVARSVAAASKSASTTSFRSPTTTVSCRWTTLGANSAVSIRRGSDSITYSGGQPSVGQGGFYGSGGARVLPVTDDGTGGTQQQLQHHQRSKMLALAQDVQNIRSTMSELDMLESLLRAEDTSASSSSSNSSNNGNTDQAGTISSKRMELKNAIKKLMTAPQFNESLNNLEIKGEPSWGLSREERELIIAARGKVNEC